MTLKLRYDIISTLTIWQHTKYAGVAELRQIFDLVEAELVPQHEIFDFVEAELVPQHEIFDFVEAELVPQADSAHSKVVNY